jgi:DNA repair protein SbcC/Rad50
MKLHRVTLQNFRRHRDTVIELPDGVTAVVGRNGSGKSTIIEAIAFGLFGPAAARTNKELVRHNDSVDPVVVELEMEIGEQAVRIRRELRGKGLNPSATLEVNGHVQVNGGGGSGEAATKQIENLLGMDLKAFITTVVARQKELSRLADESPAERKRLLLEMLGIEQIERAIERQTRRDFEGQLEAVRSLLRPATELDAEQQQAEAGVAQANEQASQAEAAWNKAADALAKAQAEVEALRAEQAAYQQAAQALQALRRDEQLASQLLQQAEAARREAAAAAEKVSRLAPVAARLPTAEQALQKAREERAAAERHAAAKKRLQAAEQECARLELQLQDPAPAPDEAGLEKAKQTLEQARLAGARLETQRDGARARLQELRGRHKRLASLGADAPCPTCERPLDTHLPRILMQAHRELHAAEEELARLEGELEQAKRHASECQNNCQHLEARHAEAVRHQAERAKVQALLDGTIKRITELKQELPPQVAAPELGPLEVAAREARQAHEQILRLTAATDARAAREEAYQQALAAHAEAQASVAQATAALPADPQARLGQAAKTCERLGHEERDHDRARQAAKHAVALAVQRLEDVTRRRAEHDQHRAKAEQMEQEMRYWNALAHPRGLLPGFKDHLIQRVGPAVAQEASRLLARFTAGRYQEIVLDDAYQVYVTDSGVRYSLDRFSGGEADLVHLALRLAVSRLLAERAGGAGIRFLALDEVFGSLDDERRNLVVAGLRELGSLYAQVLLVTHLEPMRDALDHTLEVRDEGGDAVVVLHA